MSAETIGQVAGRVVGTLVRRRFENLYMPEPNTGCWLWIGCVNYRGYGHFRGRDENGESTPRSAHRVSWELYCGPIPDGLHVLHKCDTPSCVNPDHLRLGTHQENMADRDAKGRGARGERQGFAKLTAAQALQIFQDQRRPLRVIAEEYGLAESNICNIKSGIAWSHVTGKQRE